MRNRNNNQYPGNIIRRTIIVAAACLSTVILTIQPALAKNAKPNFVFFLVDDFGWGSISAMGHEFVETPNIDRLVKSGMQFTSGYAACTVCSPSRAAILTGAYPGRINLTNWIPGHRKVGKLLIPDWQKFMDHERILLPEALKENGYRTAFIGKWHLMPGGDKDRFKEHYPGNHGFDINIGGREWGQPKGKGKYFHPFDMPNVTSKEGDYLTDRLTDYAVDIVDKNRENPFLIYFSYYTVHSPIQGKPELVKKYTEKKNRNINKFKKYNPAYAAMVQSLDESVGRVIAKLEEAGLRDNTYIIFTGDNGPDSNLYCGGLKGRKAEAHEGGTREVYLVSGPGIKPGSKSDVPVIGTDFYPTILDLAGLSLKPDQHQDGVSLKPLLTEGGSIKERSLFWHYPHYHRTKPYGAVRNGDWKLIEFFEDGKLELYNLKEDQAEQNNLAASMPEKAEALLKEMQQWRKDVGAQEMTLNPEYNPDAQGKAKAKKQKQPTNASQTQSSSNSKVKALRTSSSETKNPAKNAVDASTRSRWAASSGSFPQWIEVEYQQPETAKGVDITFHNETVIKYKVEIQDKEGKWSTVVDQSENSKEVKAVSHDINASVTKLKVTVLKAKKGWATISDIKLR